MEIKTRIRHAPARIVVRRVSNSNRCAPPGLPRREANETPPVTGHRS
jgi:hypothetical protein